MGACNLLRLCFLVSLLLMFISNSVSLSKGGGVRSFPPTCKRIECPTYDVIQSGNGFEIRRYNSSMWISTQPIVDISLVHAGNIAFYQTMSRPAPTYDPRVALPRPARSKDGASIGLQVSPRPAPLSSLVIHAIDLVEFTLFEYIQGKNDNHQKIEMTAPVMIEVKPSDGPLRASSFVVSFFIPKENQATAPSAEGLRLQKWGPTYVAVRQFSGFVMDDQVGEEAAALYASVAGTVWSDAIDRSHAGSNVAEYIVAQYNSPFEFKDRVNEIWLTFSPGDGFVL